ncbi:MAG: AAA family ATPase [Desulfosarcinaceae bacterium]|nr:AAA family ATPase [Desulfosarcinaceae bacterium]
MILLTGEVGTGKTTLISHIRRHYIDGIHTAVITNTNVTPEELLELMLQSFGIEDSPPNKPQKLERLRQYFGGLERAGEKGLLIIDDAQNLSDESLEEIRMLFSLQEKPHSGLQIFLVGQSELREKLQSPKLTSLAQRVGVNFHLPPLEPREVVEYIEHRIHKVGGKRGLFDKKALARIAVASGGIPRAINQLCDAALVYGYGYNKETIDAAIVQQVISERSGFGLVTAEDFVSRRKSGHGAKTTSPSTATQETNPIIERIHNLERSVVALTAELGEKERREPMSDAAETERKMVALRQQLNAEVNKRKMLEEEVGALKHQLATNAPETSSGETEPSKIHHLKRP